MKDKLLRQIGGRIRLIRTKKKISQEELAFNSEINVAYLSLMESGKINIGAYNLYKIAKSLDMEVGSLFPPVKKNNLIIYFHK